jgi:hypothetical protein
MSRAAVREVADLVLRRSPAQLAFRRRSVTRLAVLAYHGVDDPAQFRRQLRLLVKHWVPVTLDAVLAALDGGPPLPRHAVLLTFDDGYASVLADGLPLLREHEAVLVGGGRAAPLRWGPSSGEARPDRRRYGPVVEDGP